MFHEQFKTRFIAALILPGLLAACSPQTSSAAAAAAPASATAPAPAAAVAPPGAPLVRGLPDFANLVEQVGPAVVSVRVVEKGPRVMQGGNAQPAPDDPFSDFFRQFQNVPRNNTPVRGEGSGFIVSPDGYILTNAHVIDNASKITVGLTDRREYEAKLVGSDERTDVAVIKIDAKNLPVVRIGDPDKLRPGDWAIAIGAPFSFENSVTVGVISALGRDLGNEGSGNYVPFIQTDVAVNPGNSGGPLFNIYGEVVGINSQIYSNTGAYAGLSFAIPIDIASNVREQLIRTGHVSRGRIGVSIQEVNALQAENYGLDRPRGAAVVKVEPDSPASKAGIESEDVILSVNGKQIEHSNQVPAMIAAVKPGSSVDLELWRGKGTKHVQVTVEELKEPAKVASAGGAGSGGDAIDRVGLSVRELTRAEQQQLNTRGTVVVTAVDGAASEAGVRAGDIILSANRMPVASVSALRSATKANLRSTVLVIQREDQQLILTISLT
jgi:serine protease Do